MAEGDENDHRGKIIQSINEVSRKHDTHKVFNDWLEIAAISVSNTADLINRDKREQRYLEIIKRYDKAHRMLFPKMFACLVMALEGKVKTNGPEDVLGEILRKLELHSKDKSQFFTPQHTSDFMAQIVCDGELARRVKEDGFISAHEPACGSGVMLTSMCKAMRQAGLDYQTQLVVTAVDIDLKCVHMTYLQLALYGVPAEVIHGNTLTGEIFSRWYTPFHILGNWAKREHCKSSDTKK